VLDVGVEKFTSQNVIIVCKITEATGGSVANEEQSFKPALLSSPLGLY
jgi:hypothetical protein